MATLPDTTSLQTNRDEHLAEILNRCAEALRAGNVPSLEDEARRQPELAAELRELWPAVVIAEEVARPSSDFRSTISADRASLTPPVFQSVLRGSTRFPIAFGNYDLLEELGRGGMGVVYRAWHRGLGRTVALKMILWTGHASPADLARFRLEAESAARLDHPNIVPVYEIGEQDGHPYFTMKYVEGPTLARVVAKGPLPPRLAAQLLRDVANAVEHAHQHGILHRDLKPSNILLADEGKRPAGVDDLHPDNTVGSLDTAALVSDFGLAKRVENAESLTDRGAILGTPSYMPPEQAAGNRAALGPASDVYSLGAILYELLTGRPPFQAATPLDTLMLVLEQEPVSPRLLNPTVDRELEIICLKCLQKPIDLRYQSAAALARDLDAFLKGEPISSGPRTFGYFLSRVLRPTHHVDVLQNWGILWMAHSLQIFLLCAVTSLLAFVGVEHHGVYLALWSFGLVSWGIFFWNWRKQSGGPVTFVERQIAHAWAGGVVGSIGLFVVEILLGLKALTLSPVLAIFAAMVFITKGGTLSGIFYVTAAAMALTAAVMALCPSWLGLLVFGTTSALSFLIPGWKYYRQRVRANRGVRGGLTHSVAVSGRKVP